MNERDWKAWREEQQFEDPLWSVERIILVLQNSRMSHIDINDLGKCLPIFAKLAAEREIEEQLKAKGGPDAL